MASVDGLISGMSTTQVVAQLMQAEAAPQTQLKNKISAQQKITNAYQAVNTKVAAAQSVADELTKATTWSAVKATSSSTTVAASAVAGAVPGQLTFDVRELARAQVTTGLMDESAPLTTNGTLTLTGAGLTDPLEIIVDAAETDPAVLANAINEQAKAAGANIKATVVTTDQGKMLQLTGTKTGEANAFTLTGLVTATKDAVTANDALVRVGDPTDPLNGGYTISSATNTFTEAIAGVSMTVSKVEDAVTIDVMNDANGLADKMQALVDAANSAFDEIAKSSKYDPITKSGGPLTSDFKVRQLQMNMLSAVSGGTEDYGSFAQAGLKLDRGGKFTFDRAMFLAEYQKNPENLQAAIADGLATTLKSVADEATNKTTGRLTLAIQHGNDQVKDLNTRISNWDVRLDARKAALERQFANLEVALGKMKSQSSWLSGAIAGLPTGG